METLLSCDVCGNSANIEGVESPAVMQGFIDSWSEAHRHTVEERKQYHDAQIAVDQYRHSHPFGEGADDDE